MDSEALIQLLQNSFRVTLGATASLVEILQDPYKRDENLTKLRQELSQLSEEWAAKGESTEQEARNFVDTLFNSRSPGAPDSSSSAAASASATAPPDVQVELQALTDQIAALRSELEKIRASEN